MASKMNISHAIAAKRCLRFLLIVLVLASSNRRARTEERLIIQLKDFRQTELKSGGFILPTDMQIHISALGGGENKTMFAYGWIIDADTRKTVWIMGQDNTTREKDDRRFDGRIFLRKGSYEAYFTAYAFSTHSAFSHITINIDHRDKHPQQMKRKKRGLVQWLEDLFGNDFQTEWKHRAKNWGVDIYVEETSEPVRMFIAQKSFPLILFKAIRLGENEYIRQRFTLTKPLSLRIYAIGEMDYDDDLADYGRIVDARTHKALWLMKKTNLHPAGGAKKNVLFDSTVLFPAGDFIIYYHTDDSHSYLDWNAAPPCDPLNYGISIIGTKEDDSHYFKLVSTNTENQNIIVQFIRLGNNEWRSASFSLKSETSLRIYALGERSSFRRRLVDYGWIINAKTRKRVWSMDVERTEHAGGARKNRMIDEIITLPKGTYTIFFKTDDSHAFNSWNESPPFEPEYWGITIMGIGENFTMENIVKNISPEETGVIAQIVQVGDNADIERLFKLKHTTHIKIYALGEGLNREMYDYGWIEDRETGKVIWEMTYSMTFHAGGNRKNRLVSTALILAEGEYLLHYVSDGSHSFNHWNADPPDDPTMWGITIYED